jgi:hypothetical protein
MSEAFGDELELAALAGVLGLPPGPFLAADDELELGLWHELVTRALRHRLRLHRHLAGEVVVALSKAMRRH